MTDSKGTDTGQISVAELLARNGKKVGSRSSGGGRRRRGTTGGISVAELTGEIPITRVPADPEPAAQSGAGTAVISGAGAAVEDNSPQVPAVATPKTPKVEPAVPETPRVEPVVPETPKVATPTLSTPTSPSKTASPATPAPPSANELTTITPRGAIEDATTVTPAVGKSATGKQSVRKSAGGKSALDKAAFGTSAVEDHPTTVSDGAKVESPTEIIRPEALPRRARAHLDSVAVSAPAASSPPPRASDVPEPRLLSGPASDLQGTGADDGDDTDTIGVAQGDDGDRPSPKGKPTSKGKTSARGKAASKDDAESSSASAAKSNSGRSKPGTTEDDGVDKSEGGVKQWALLIGESIAAIVVGGLLFKGFEKLWDMMPWVAFGLALLVIVGLVALVRVLRRTDDITSQLIAVGVGAFVAFGPLLFLLPNG